MNTLRDFQQSFAESVFEAKESGIESDIIANGLSSNRRLNVYRNNIVLSLTEALRAVYPVIDKLVGAEFFGHIAKAFIQDHPSRSGNLHSFGEEFPQYLSDFNGLEALVYASDVARLEWAYHEAFHAGDCNMLDLTRLAAVNLDDYDQLIFSLNPSARLLISDYPVLHIWEVNQEQFVDDETVSLDEGGQHILVIRRALDIEFEPLGRGEYNFLLSLTQGSCLDAACDKALSSEPAFDITACLNKHVLNQTLVGFSTNPVSTPPKIGSN